MNTVTTLATACLVVLSLVCMQPTAQAQDN